MKQLLRRSELGVLIFVGLVTLTAPLRAEDAPAPASEPVNYEQFLQEARKLMKAGKWDAASELLHQARELEPDRYEVRALLTLLDLEQEDKYGAHARQIVWMGFDETAGRAPPEAAPKIAALKETITRTFQQREQGREQLRRFLKQARNRPGAEQVRNRPSEEQTRAYTRLTGLIVAADGEPGIPGRRGRLAEFLVACRQYLSVWSKDTNIWLLRAMVALELDSDDDGIVAWRYLQKVAQDGNSVRNSFGDLPGTLRRLEQRSWSHAAMTRAESAEFLAHGGLGQAPANALWVNSLNMGFVQVAGVLFAQFETRVAEYHLFAKETGREWSWEHWQSAVHPAVNVSWNDANAFCEWLTRRERKLGIIAANQGYRLPLDREWSEANGLFGEVGFTVKDREDSMSGRELFYEWGAKEFSANLCEESILEVMPTATRNYLAGYNDGYPRTCPVGAFPPNQIGIYGLIGNVSEWVHDYYDHSHTKRALRGGNWADTSFVPTVSKRLCAPETHRSASFGFRCVLVTP